MDRHPDESRTSNPSWLVPAVGDPVSSLWRRVRRGTRLLRRSADWDRFAGVEVAVKGRGVLAGREKRLEGTLLGLRGDEEAGQRVALRLSDGEEVEIPLAEIDRGNLVYRWERGGKGR